MAAALGRGQSPFPMRWLDQVGLLGSEFDRRTEVDLGFAKVFPDPDGMLRIEGQDDARKTWRVHMPPGVGVAGTEIWSADFDRNGRKDLLIAAYEAPNGRCVDLVELTFLLFDARGRPLPWRMRNYYPSVRRKRRVPAILRQSNPAGRAELVTTGCEYSDPADWSRWGEDRRITGVYEAHDAHWLPRRVAAADQRAAESTDRGRSVKWLPSDPQGRWFDQLSGIDSAQVKLMRLMPFDPKCHGVFIPLVHENGVWMVSREPDPCRDAADRVLYSDGAALLGWPPVVIDSPQGREIYIPGERDDTKILQRVIREGLPLKRLGNPATPDWLWVEKP